MTGKRNCWPAAGFSLIELLTVVAVMLILLAAAVPSMHGLVRGRQLRAATAEFQSAIYLARSEAIRRGVRVDLLALDDDWRNGWIVYVDRNRNRRADAGDDVVYRHDVGIKGLAIESVLLDNSMRYLAYDPSGRSRTDASAHQPQFGTFRFRLAGQQRNIVLNMLGRARVCTPPAGNDSC